MSGRRPRRWADAALGVLATVGLAAGGMVAGASPASAAYDVTGVDVSAYQHGSPINWGSVAAAEDFAIVKATEGMSGNFDNDYFAGDFDAAKSNGMIVGSYHFADVGTPVESDAKGEAQHYFDVTKGRNGGAGVLPPVLDIENAKGLSVSQVRLWTKTFLVEAERLFGRKPMIYSFSSFSNTYLNTSTFAQYKLWLAHYTTASAPSKPSAWNDWTIWQYTDKASVNGISGGVDRNRFNGTLSELKTLANGGGSTDPDPVARNGVCETGEFCLYYNSDQGGSLSDFDTDIPNYGDSQPSCYDFKSAGAGQGLCVKNETASVWNRTGRSVTVFVNSNYAGGTQSFSAGTKANLNSTLKNNNASHRIG